MWVRRPNDEVLNVVEERIAAVSGIPTSSHETPMQLVSYERPFAESELEVQLKLEADEWQSSSVRANGLGLVQASLDVATGKAQAIQSLYPLPLAPLQDHKSHTAVQSPGYGVSGFRMRVLTCGAQQVFSAL